MSERKKKLIHLFYGIYLAVFIISAALHLIFGCCEIYFDANSEFSREIVSVQFSKIAVPIYISLVGIIGGIILSIALPIDEEMSILSKKRHVNYRMVRERLAQKVDVGTMDSTLAKGIKKERSMRLISVCVCIGLCVVAAVPLLIHICNPNNYDKSLINESIIPAVILTLIWCLLAFIYFLALSIINRVSVKAEIALLKEAIAAKSGIVKKEIDAEAEKKQRIILWSVRCAILMLAAVFIIVGIVNGGMADVLGKAIRLCTECIGLG